MIKVHAGSLAAPLIGSPVAVTAAAPPGIGDFSVRVRTGQANLPGADPGTVWAGPTGGGTAGPFTMTNGQGHGTIRGRAQSSSSAGASGAGRCTCTTPFSRSIGPNRHFWPSASSPASSWIFGPGNISPSTPMTATVRRGRARKSVLQH